MESTRKECLLLFAALLGGFVSAWQLALFREENSFLDGICAAEGPRSLAPEARALRLFHWVCSYDDAPGDGHRPSGARPPIGGSSSDRPGVSRPAPHRRATAPVRRTADAGLGGLGAPRRDPREPGLDVPLAAVLSGGSFVTPQMMVARRADFRDDCGTKAWLLVLLAGRAGLAARELRLCDARHIARHVVCEVRLAGRWVVLDPTADVAFRRQDGRLATVAELRDRRLLAVNMARAAPPYHRDSFRFDHAERLHFEKLPLVGGLARRLAARIAGRPAAELALPQFLERPRLVLAGSFAALALLALLGRGCSVLSLLRLSAPPPLRQAATEE